MKKITSALLSALALLGSAPTILYAVGDAANAQCLDSYDYGPGAKKHTCTDSTNGADTRGYCRGPHECFIEERNVSQAPPGGDSESALHTGSVATPAIETGGTRVIPFDHPYAQLQPEDRAARTPKQIATVPETPGTGWDVVTTDNGKKIFVPPPSDPPVKISGQEVPLYTESEWNKRDTLLKGAGEKDGMGLKPKVFLPESSGFGTTQGNSGSGFISRVASWFGLARYATGIGTFFGAVLHSSPLK